MIRHRCYYCHQDLVKGKTLVTFYTKECHSCPATYHLDLNHNITLIVLDATIRNRYYSVLHHPNMNAIRVLTNCRDGLGKEIVVDLGGDYNTITPSNLTDKLKTILTFL